MNSKTRYFVNFFFTVCQISVNASLLAPENYLIRVNFQKFYFFNLFHVQLFVISI